jgi:undecaprenyl-diphosphatase
MGYESDGEASAGFAAFTAVIQIGTQVAIMLYFAKDIGRILVAWCKTFPQAVRSGFGQKNIQRIGHDAYIGWLIIFGTIPIVVAGILLKHSIETTFRTLWLTGILLIVFGVILYLADRYSSRLRTLAQLNSKHNLLIGLAQCLALFPGVSRSGATISAGRLLGYGRRDAAKFSFYLAIPSVLGAGLFELKDAIGHFGEPDFLGAGPTIVATLVAFVVGYVVIAAFMRALNKISFKGFAYYRIAVGAFVLIGTATGIL